MKSPLEVTVDLEWPIGYVRYLDDEAPFDGTLSLIRDPDGVVRDHAFCNVDYRSYGVHIDVTPDDDIIGFEIMCVDDPRIVAIARDYARDNDLAFPDDLRAAAARDPAA